MQNATQLHAQHASEEEVEDKGRGKEVRLKVSERWNTSTQVGIPERQLPEIDDRLAGHLRKGERLIPIGRADHVDPTQEPPMQSHRGGEKKKRDQPIDEPTIPQCGPCREL